MGQVAPQKPAGSRDENPHKYGPEVRGLRQNKIVAPGLCLRYYGAFIYKDQEGNPGLASMNQGFAVACSGGDLRRTEDVNAFLDRQDIGYPDTKVFGDDHDLTAREISFVDE